MTFRIAALALAAGLVAAPVISGTALAQTSTPSQTQTPAGKPHREGHRLNLTEDQKKVFKEQGQKIREVYTPEQRAQLEAGKGSKSWKEMSSEEKRVAMQKRREAQQTVQQSLTSDQKRRIEDARAAMRATLTPEQRQQMDERMQQRAKKAGQSPS